MIRPEVIQEVERLLLTGGLSMRKIAEQTRISRGLVSAIAHGKRKLKPRPVKKERPENMEIDENGEVFFLPTGPMARCPECGAMVRTPCLACQIARALRRSPRQRKGKVYRRRSHGDGLAGI